MIVGHAMLAFAIVALAARQLGWESDRALRVGALAGILAMVPDVDMVYALVGLTTVDTGALLAETGVRRVFTVTGAFWGASTVAHRSATHSLVLAVPVAGAVAAWTHEGRASGVLAVATVAAITAISWTVSGPVDGAVVGLFGILALAVAEIVRHDADVTPATTGVVALVALVSHPFGDLFTGEPPKLLYPLPVELLESRVALSADPTIHLLAAFGLELLVVWLAAVAYLRLTGNPTRRFVHRRAGLAVAYGFGALLLPPPTLEVSYHFVFTVLGMGLVLAIPELGRPGIGRVRSAVRTRSLDAERPLALALTGIAAVTIGWMAYFAAYVAR